MAAYVLILREGPVTDPASMAEYTRLISQGAPPANMKVHTLYGPQDPLLGTPPDGVVIMEFPSMAEAREWYDSPRYREARVFRQKAAEHRELIVEGFSMPGMS
jgi:uncharacterized protein (DUF1330 family)